MSLKIARAKHIVTALSTGRKSKIGCSSLHTKGCRVAACVGWKDINNLSKVVQESYKCTVTNNTINATHTAHLPTLTSMDVADTAVVVDFVFMTPTHWNLRG